MDQNNILVQVNTEIYLKCALKSCHFDPLGTLSTMSLSDSMYNNQTNRTILKILPTLILYTDP